MKVTDVAVYGLEESLVASGYPMRAEVKPESLLEEARDVEESLYMDKYTSDKDYKRGVMLANTPLGSGHSNFLKGIIVQFNVDFTIKEWTEAERYHFLDFVSSCSTMHKLKDMELDKSYCEFVDKRVVGIMKELQKAYKEDPTKENMYKMLYTNPCGLKLTARMTTNYLQLKTIYHQRKNHRLDTWKEFCRWIEQLPLAKELICDFEGAEE